KPREAKGTWVEPKLVAEVSFAEWTRDGKVRHAVFHGLREDKPAAAIGRERPAAMPRGPASGNAPMPAESAAGTPAVPEAPVRITHPERVIDPGTGLTKRDLIDYYLHAARRLLPHLAKRPVALVRAPSGVQGQHFFQKHSGGLRIEGLRELPADLDPGHPPLIEIDSFVALVSAAQMNVVEFHTWNACSSRIEKPDRMTFDLDPGEGVPWPAMIDAARLTRRVLDEIGLRSFLKTSGGKGLHIVVPLAPREGWDEVKDFSRQVVERLAALAPDKLVVKSGPKNRVGRIFVDYLRNGRGATTVAAFSARARAGLGVSMPCAWDELDSLTGGAHWTIATAHQRLESADDPWADYKAVRQTLTAPRKALARPAGAAPQRAA
ncbi:MAG: DNA ligase D, partial [Rhizobacter sp.]